MNEHGTMSTQPVTEADLHAFVDGQLDEEREAEIGAWLAQHPEEAARVHAWQEQMRALRGVYDPVLDEPVPLRLSVSKAATRAGMKARPRWPMALAAGLACLLIGGLAGWMARGASTTSNMASAGFARQALAAHVLFAAEQRHPVEVPAAQEAHLVTWLSKRLDAKIQAPDLQAQGFSLLGGRLLPGEPGPLAQLMYQSTAGERLTLTVRHASKAGRETGFQVLQQEGATAFYWIDRDYGYALSGNIGRERMLDVARAVELQLYS